MNEPDIPAALPCPPGSTCYAYSPWPRFPVVGPLLIVVIAVVAALLLVSNAQAFNDVNAELQIAAREQRGVEREAARLAQAQRRVLLAQAATRPADDGRSASADRADRAAASPRAFPAEARPRPVAPPAAPLPGSQAQAQRAARTP